MYLGHSNNHRTKRSYRIGQIQTRACPSINYVGVTKNLARIRVLLRSVGIVEMTKTQLSVSRFANDHIFGRRDLKFKSEEFVPACAE